MTTAEDEGPAVLFERREGIGIATLNRPRKLHALSPDIIQGLRDAITKMEEDPTAKVLILTANGRGFCSGADLSAGSREGRAPQISNWPRARPEMYPAVLFRNANFPIIGAINGVAAGAGMSIALSPDIRIMSDQARMIPIFIKRGVMPDMGLNYFLPRIVGVQKALEMMWTGESIPPEECLELGLVSRVVHHDDLMPAALELAGRLAKGPTIAIAMTKHAVYRNETGTLESDLEWVNFAQNRCFVTADFREGAAAFREKREAVFKGE